MVESSPLVSVLFREEFSYPYTVKNGVFQNICLGCLNVHSSIIPNRVFLKPPFEGVTGHPQISLQLAVNHSKGCYANTYTLLILNFMSL